MGVGDDALLHKMVCALQRGGSWRLMAGFLGVCGRTDFEHRVTDFNGKENGISK